MGSRFQKRTRIFKGLTLNLSKSGTSWTVGGPGASVNVRGEKVTGTVGAPGTGLSCRQTLKDESEHDGSEPYSAELTAVENERRQRNLAAELRSRSLSFADGVGQHPSNGWAAEPSFLVFGLTLEAAKTLCARLEQNGFVWSGADAVPKLILLK